MRVFILEEVSHCWDLWKYPDCSAINSVYFPLTKTCQHSSSLTWVYFPAWGSHKCLCPLSTETSLRFRHWSLCSLLGSVIEPGSHSCSFWSFFSNERPLPGQLSLFPLSLLLWQVFAFLRCSDFYCISFCSFHFNSSAIHTYCALPVQAAVSEWAFSKTSYGPRASLGLILHLYGAFQFCEIQLYK